MRTLALTVIFIISGLIVGTPVGAADINTELIDATRAKNIQKVKDTISNGAKIDANMNSVEQSGITPLMVAAETLDNTSIGNLLIEKGAHVNAKDVLGWTPLIYATYNGRIEFVRLLLENAADVNAKSNSGWTALMYAASKGQVEIGKLLIDKGADVNAKSRKGETALSVAESRSWGNFADLLRKQISR